MPKSETLKSHHRRRGCVLGQGATKKSKEGEVKRRQESPHDVADQEMIRRRQSLSRNRSELSGYPWERQMEMAGRHQEWRDEIHGIFCTLIGVCASDLEIKSKRKYLSAVSAKTRRRQACRVFIPLTFMISCSDSRADRVAAGYCS